MASQSPAEHDAWCANGVVHEIGKLDRRKPIDWQRLMPLSYRRLRGTIITDRRVAPSQR